MLFRIFEEKEETKDSRLNLSEKNKKNSFFPMKRPYSDIEKGESSMEKPIACLSERKIGEKSDFPRNIGKAIIKGYTLRSFNLSHLKKGDELFLKREKKVLIDDNKKKKKTKPITNKGLNDNIIRILTRNQEVFSFK
jgi:hypothetical protein